MSRMMDALHELRERHHERVKDLPFHEREIRFPRECEHCGHDLSPATQSSDSLPLAEGYTVLEVTGMEDGKATARIQSPPCPKCSRRSVFELVCQRS